jgi:integrase/recombinase XerC
MTRSQFNHYVANFIKYLSTERQASHHTIRAYKTDLTQFLEFWAQLEETHKRSFIDLANIFEMFCNQLYQAHDTKTVARRLSCFSSLNKFLSLSGSSLNITFSRPAIQHKSPSYLTLEEIQYLLDELPVLQLPSQRPLRDRAILELLYSTGMKSSEIVQLRINDIDHQHKTLTITHTKKPSRTISMGENGYAKLMEYINKERALISHAEEYIFVNYKNQPITTRSIQRICNMFSSFLERTCVITPLMLRHSCARHMLDRGASVSVIQTLLGLAAVSIEKYTKLS